MRFIHSFHPKGGFALSKCFQLRSFSLPVNKLGFVSLFVVSFCCFPLCTHMAFEQQTWNVFLYVLQQTERSSTFFPSDHHRHLLPPPLLSERSSSSRSGRVARMTKCRLFRNGRRGQSEFCFDCGGTCCDTRSSLRRIRTCSDFCQICLHHLIHHTHFHLSELVFCRLNLHHTDLDFNSSLQSFFQSLLVLHNTTVDRRARLSLFVKVWSFVFSSFCSNASLTFIKVLFLAHATFSVLLSFLRSLFRFSPSFRTLDFSRLTLTAGHAHVVHTHALTLDESGATILLLPLSSMDLPAELFQFFFHAFLVKFDSWWKLTLNIEKKFPWRPADKETTDKERSCLSPWFCNCGHFHFLAGLLFSPTTIFCFSRHCHPSNTHDVPSFYDKQLKGWIGLTRVDKIDI